MRRRGFLRLLGFLVGAPSSVVAALRELESSVRCEDKMDGALWGLEDGHYIQLPDGFEVVSMRESDDSCHLIVEGWWNGEMVGIRISDQQFAEELGYSWA